ncbi:MAG TPA: patatin-like phospholipase family protein [Gemmatimonas sp.]|nr:patatin-like phospholipase family protein [Gemmatimonas sp.]
MSVSKTAASLSLRAGPRALALLRERGLRFDDVDVLPGASGGAKWLVLAGIDRYLFGEFLRAPDDTPRSRPLHGIGSSIGSWRLACLGQRDPLAALERGHDAYIFDQQYSSRPSTDEITSTLVGALDRLLGPTGVSEILSHPWLRIHIITAQGRGLAASSRRGVLASSIALAAAGNFVSRRTLAAQMRRCVFHSSGDTTPFAQLADLPTSHVALTRENCRAALMASGSIPLLVHGVRVPGTEGVHWDGGVLDYHLDLDFGVGDGLVLYPHFYPHIVPGWFDKSLSWRRARGANFQRTLLIAPSSEFVASLPGGRIPDRRDFRDFSHAERIARWTRVRQESERLGDALRELVLTGRIAEHVQPW